ncbi:STAS domain-containing protein [Polyangium sp. 6x1]|uniref:STAS domain-containing protein n=1 Tax=Polyangium sp. 6x1 TaxID=3042689 RepID=UPI0024825696|nr:STAS domain-containing protein [Polyangium sp. 6x1]MDI1450537.1 STAS domain-containing protein [Polyangium sp. 6x1]
MQNDSQARRFFSTNPDVCLVVRPDGTIAQSNLAAERVFGAGVRQGAPLGELGALSAAYEEVHEGGEPSVFDCSLRERDGGRAPYVCVAWRAEGDEIYVALRPKGHLDVSELKRVEQELLAKMELIHKQQQVIKDLGIPIIQVWDQVLTLPLVGVVDSARAADVMENLLQTVVQTRARFAILDLTGVDLVDTATAAHLLQMINAIRLMGAEGIITGIRPTVAQTMIGLGLDMSTTTTLASLRDALKLCIRRMSSS